MTRRRRILIVCLIGVGLAIAVAGYARYRSVARRALLMRADPNAILSMPKARAIALADGRPIFAAHCASCHGAEGKGSTVTGVPDLTDDDFLYGEGNASEIEQIVLHGIRAGDSKGWNLADMPGFAKPVPYRREPLSPLTPGEVRDLTVFLRAANGNGGYERDQIERGRSLFATKAGCWDCHGHDGRGDGAIGAPNLVDGKWLKGDGSEQVISRVIERGMAGMSPAFARFLSPYDVRAVSIYVASLHPPAK